MLVKAQVSVLIEKKVSSKGVFSGVVPTVGLARSGAGGVV